MLTTPLGIMRNEPFVGSWVGLFWHRNHTGSIFSFFSTLFLMRFLWDIESGTLSRSLFVLFYLLSVLFVVMSRSAAGIIVFLYLHLLIFIVSIWLKFNDRIKKWQYYIVAAVLLLGALIFIFNTEYFFGLLGRSSTMTGRVPLWQDLWSTVFAEKPVLGYGYGALWMQESFRHLMQSRHNWKYEVFFADNGFFDVLLNLGLVGFMLFMGFYLDLGVESLKNLIKEKSWLLAIPLLALNYVFIGNLAYSFILEVDQFVWVLLIIWGFTTGVHTLMKDA
jgi:O-antigen ligase